jgi:hypothetical protein
MPTGGRKLHLQVIHEISQAFGASTPLSGVLGVLPAGAVLLTAHLVAATAFNSTTNTLALGTTPGGNQLLGATDLKTVARTDTPVPVANQGPLAVDTPVYWTLALTGATPTAGAAVAFIDYLPGVG